MGGVLQSRRTRRLDCARIKKSKRCSEVAAIFKRATFAEWMSLPRHWTRASSRCAILAETLNDPHAPGTRFDRRDRGIKQIGSVFTFAEIAPIPHRGKANTRAPC